MNDPQNASGAYALNALTAAERAEFEAAMASSEQLRAEAIELADTAVELGLGVAPENPPPSLRADLLAALDANPQLGADTPAERRARNRWRTPVLRLGAVAASIALVAGLGVAVRAGLHAQAEMVTAAQIEQIEAAADSQRTTVEAMGGSATLIWSETMHRAALMADGMPRPPEGRTYALWYIDTEGATPAGTFDGDGGVVLTGQMDAGDTVGVTVEPAGGSDAPSSDPIIMIETA
jgi:anti-sigma-K factor RskA